MRAPWSDPRASGGDPLQDRLDDALARLARIEFGDEFDPAAPAAIVAAGLHLAPVPVGQAGSGSARGRRSSCSPRSRRSTARPRSGFAMHVHVVGSMADSPGWPTVCASGCMRPSATTARCSTRRPPRTRRQSGPWRAPRDDRHPGWRRLPPDRREVVDHLAAGAPVRAGDGPGGDRRRGSDGRPPRIGLFVVDLEAPGVTRLPGFEALGMRGSASGRLRLEGVRLAADPTRHRTACDRPGPTWAVAGRLVRAGDRRRLPRGRRGCP